ncbi:hypothetical protein [Amycolatopsis sp. GA6-003]|uniref:hypothetical protein n=1 Tax=Amycolatopsis sp. GA6-003 TaxID=2652444 RepID=UPI003916FE18
MLALRCPGHLDAADLAVMRTLRKPGGPISEAEMAASERYVRRNHPKGRIPQQLVEEFPSHVWCKRCQAETKSGSAECNACGAAIRLHWTADDETTGAAR